MKKTDRLAVSKLIFKYIKQSLRSPYAVCMLVRAIIINKLIQGNVHWNVKYKQKCHVFYGVVFQTSQPWPFISEITSAMYYMSEPVQSLDTALLDTFYLSNTAHWRFFCISNLNLLPYYLTRIVYEGDNKYRKNLLSLVYLFVVDPHCIQVSWWGAWSVSTRLLYKYYCYSLCKYIIFFVGGWWGDILKVSLFYGSS